MNDIKENFCGACVTIPLAFAGAGTAFGVEKRQTLQRAAVFLTVASIALSLYFVYMKNCRSCKF